MTAGDLENRSSGPARFFLIAMLFVVAAPFFWQRVEILRATTTGIGENAALFDFTYPAMKHGFGRLRNGEWPLWNPTQLAGYPFHADHRVGLYQPLNAPFLWMPTGKAMAIQAFTCLLLMGVGMALLIRGFGASHGPALIAGTVYAFSGASASVMSHPSAAAAFAWAPFTLWTAHMHRQKFTYTSGVFHGLIAALLILSGSWSAAVLVFLFATPALLWTIVRPLNPLAPPFRKRLLSSLGALLIALGVSAIQWVPTTAWARQLAEPWPFLADFGVSTRLPNSLISAFTQMIWTGPAAVPRMGYFGVAGFILAAAAVFNRPLRRAACYLAAVAILSTAGMAVPDTSLPLALPAAAFGAPLALSVAALAGLGADHLLRPRRPLRTRPVWQAGLFITLLCAGIFATGTHAVRAYTLIFAALILPCLIIRARWITASAAVLLALVLYVDLINTSVNVFRHPYHDAPAWYERNAAAIAAAADLAGQGRVMLFPSGNDAEFIANLGLLEGLVCAGGARLPLDQAQAGFWQNLPSQAQFPVTLGQDLAEQEKLFRALNLLSANTILTTDAVLYGAALDAFQGMGWRPEPAPGDARLLYNPNALPRAYWISKWRVEPQAVAATQRITSSDFAPEAECVVDAAPADVSGEVDGAALTFHDGRCSLTERGEEAISVHVEAPQAGLLVLTDTWAPGWKASVNGERKPLLRANGVFRAVAVPAGASEVRFDYTPWPARAGRIVTLLTLGGLLVVAPFTWRKRRRSR